MWRSISACLLVVGLALAHHEGADHEQAAAEEHKALIMLEIEPNVQNGSNSKDKRQTSQAVYGASPGQFAVRTGGDDSSPDVPAEYISLLQQLVAQQQESGSEGQSPEQPLIHQLLVARNPDPSAVQFSSNPGQPQRPRRPPPSPQAQLQQLYFDRQFQQQIPVRPRLLRPPPRPAAPTPDDFSTLTPSTSQVHRIHEARLRASLAGSDPNLAVQAISQQQDFPTSPSPSSPSLFDTQLPQFASTQEQLQTLPQSTVSQQQVFSGAPQVRIVQQQQPVQRAASYASPIRQASPSQQLVSSDRTKLSRRPAPTPEQQYLRETTQTLPEQTLLQLQQREQTSDPKIYLASQSGQQNPSSAQDDEFIAQLLSGGRGFFSGGSSTPSSIAEEVIKSTTALPPTPSRSAIYVTQSAKVKDSPKVTIEEVGATQDDAQTPIPVVHLPTPEGQRPLTQNEFQALIEAGFNISPAPQESERLQPVSPQQYYQVPTTTTTKKQRSYVTPAPPARNQVAYQARQKKPQEEKEEVRYIQQQPASEEEEVQQRTQINTRYQLQGAKPQQEEHTVQYVRKPVSEQRQRVRQGTQYSRFRIVAAEPEEQTIQFIQLQTTPEDQTYQTEEDRSQETTQLHRFQEDREGSTQQVQTTRYQTEPQEQTYQTEPVSLPQQTPSYQREQSVHRFHPIIVAELPTTTPVPSSSAPRRRRPRPPTHSRIVFRNQPQEESSSTPEATQQYLVSYDNIPEASSFGTRNRVRGRRPGSSEE